MHLRDSAGSLNSKWRPVLDGKIFADYPTKLLAEGKFARVPVIVGSTSNETSSSVLGTDLAVGLHRAFPQLTDEDLAEFLLVYDPVEFSEDEWIRTAVGEPRLRCGREIIGDAGVKFSNAWTYRFNQPNPTRGSPDITEHSAENWMMFLGSNTGTNGSVTFTNLNDAETAFSQELIAYWLSFVRSGDPNTFKLARSPEWPSYSTGRRAVLQEDPKEAPIGSGVFAEMEPQKEADRCAFIASKADRMQD